MGKVEVESIVGGALALTASFAWRDYFTSFIDMNYPIKGENLNAKFMYAIIITIVIFMLFYCYIWACERVREISPTVNSFFTRKEQQAIDKNKHT